MRERAAELGGACVVESPPGTGVQLCAWLPISKEERTEDRDGADGAVARGAAARLDR